jgi:ABC-type transport system involved in multi-copper enzyme maturation permease subunit
LLIFHVPFVGNFATLCLAAFFFILTTLGAGLFISTVSKTQQQANMATFLFFQPFMMLSGFSFPIRNMPEGVQYFTYLNPMRYFLEIVRGIFLKGSGHALAANARSRGLRSNHPKPKRPALPQAFGVAQCNGNQARRVPRSFKNEGSTQLANAPCAPRC